MVLISEQIWEIARRASVSLAAIEAADASGSPDAAGCAGSAGSLPGLVARLDDTGLQSLLADAAGLRSQADALIAAGAGVIAKRSERVLGYSGLAQRQGHRSPVAMLQALTGSSRIQAPRQVRLDAAMGEADAATRLAAAGATDTGLEPRDAFRQGDTAESAAVVLPWFEPITRAVTEHALTPEVPRPCCVGSGNPTNAAASRCCVPQRKNS